MTTIFGSVRLRPTRIGLLVRPTQSNHSAVVRFARVCACLWGGRYNPIIPVAASVPKAWRRSHARLSGRDLADGYLRFFEPDVFVEATPGLSEELGIDRGTSLDRRVVTLDEFVEVEAGRRTEFAFGLSVFDVFRFRYERELQFTSRHKRRFAVVQTAAQRPSFFDVVCGVFPVDPALAYIRQAYVDAFEPKEFEPTAEAFLEIVREGFETPFRVGRHGIEREYESGLDPTVFVFDSTNTVDLIDCWNLALFRRDVLPIERAWVKSCSALVRDYVVRNYRPIPGNPFGTMIDTTVEFARSVGEEAVNEVRDCLRDVPAKSVGLRGWYDPIWRPYTRRGGPNVYRASLSAGSEDVELEMREERHVLSVPALCPEFAERFGSGRNTARWANVLRLRNFSGSADVAVTYPSNYKNPDYPRLRVGDETLVSREGFVLLQRYIRNAASLRLERHQDAIIGWLKRAGLSVAPSAAGRNAQEALNTVGGLIDSGILANAHTLHLLEKMAKTVHEGSSGLIAHYPDRTAAVSEWKAMLSKRAKSATFRAVSLSTFTDHNIIRVGIAVQCPRCMQENWYDLARVDYSVKCDRCLRDFAFPQGGLRFGEPDWRFRVVGPFSLPNYALGAYSTILTLRLLGGGLGGSHDGITYSTGLDIEADGVKREFDFVAWYTPDRTLGLAPEPVLVFGETKSFGSEVVHQADVDRLKAMAQRFPGAYFVVSVLKDGLSEPEKQRLRKFARWGRMPLPDGEPRAGLVVLTGVELFAEWHVKRAWEERGGAHARFANHYPIDDLWTLADVTQQLYLDLPGQHASRTTGRLKAPVPPSRPAG